LREPTIARNYAEALFASAERSKQTDLYADLIEGVAGAIASDDKVRIVIESPRVPKAEKQRLLTKALKGKAPEPFLRFLSAVVKRARQNLFSEISNAYLGLVDVKLNRVRAGVTLAQEPDEKMRQAIAQGLRQALKKDVIPSYRVDPEILGGVVVRVGDRVFDGSVRRKAT